MQGIIQEFTKGEEEAEPESGDEKCTQIRCECLLKSYQHSLWSRDLWHRGHSRNL